jgi:PAS domain S-box-containing protein
MLENLFGDIIEKREESVDMDKEKRVRVSSDNKKIIDISGECCHWFIETSIDAMGVRLDHKFVYCNLAMMKLLGAKSKHELIGRSIFDFIATDQIDMVRKRVCESAKTDRPLSFIEEKLKRLDGKPVIVEASSMNINYFGKPAVMCVFHDITARKQIEQALINSEQRYRRLMENANDAIFLADVETGKLVDCNNKAEQLLGIPRKEILGASYKKLHPRDILKDVEEAFHIFAKGGHGQLDTLVKKNDGTTVWVSISGAAFELEGKKYALGLFRDITKRKNIEEALKESEERYSSFARNFRGIAFQGDMDFKPDFFHGAVEKMTGYTEEDFLTGKQRWDHIVFHEDLARIKDSVDKLKSIPHFTAEREYRIVCKDKKIRWVHESVQNICDESGRPVKVQGSVYDIDDQKRFEIALEESEIRLREQKNVLERKNAALEELLERIEVEKKKIKTQVVSNVNTLLVPVLERMRRKKTYSTKYIDLVEQNLKGLVSNFGLKISNEHLRLSPREVEVCNMIKSGFKTKEISGALNISSQTVDRHRNNIRKKLGIVKKEINLVSFLQHQNFP